MNACTRCGSQPSTLRCTFNGLLYVGIACDHQVSPCPGCSRPTGKPVPPGEEIVVSDALDAAPADAGEEHGHVEAVMVNGEREVLVWDPGHKAYRKLGRLERELGELGSWSRRTEVVDLIEKLVKEEELLLEDLFGVLPSRKFAGLTLEQFHQALLSEAARGFASEVLGLEAGGIQAALTDVLSAIERVRPREPVPAHQGGSAESDLAATDAGAGPTGETDKTPG